MHKRQTYGSMLRSKGTRTCPRVCVCVRSHTIRTPRPRHM